MPNHQMDSNQPLLTIINFEIIRSWKLVTSHSTPLHFQARCSRSTSCSRGSSSNSDRRSSKAAAAAVAVVVVFLATVLVSVAEVAPLAKGVRFMQPFRLLWLLWILKEFLISCLSSAFLQFDLACFRTFPFFFFFFFWWAPISVSFCTILTLSGMRSKMARFATVFVRYGIASFPVSISVEGLSWLFWVFPGAW